MRSQQYISVMQMCALQIVQNMGLPLALKERAAIPIFQVKYLEASLMQENGYWAIKLGGKMQTVHTTTLTGLRLQYIYIWYI